MSARKGAVRPPSCVRIAVVIRGSMAQTAATMLAVVEDVPAGTLEAVRLFAPATGMGCPGGRRGTAGHGGARWGGVRGGKRRREAGG